MELLIAVTYVQGSRIILPHWRDAEPKSEYDAIILDARGVALGDHGHALLLVLIIFAWTPPHFWALAIHRREEYAAVDIPMLPVTHGVAFTKLHILLYTLIMFVITLLPYATRMSGPLYLLGAVVLGGGFLYWAIELMRDKNPHAPIETFKYSIIYLMALFVVMLVDHYLYPVSTL